MSQKKKMDWKASSKEKIRMSGKAERDSCSWFREEQILVTSLVLGSQGIDCSEFSSVNLQT